MSCIGIYFFLVIALFQSMDNSFMIQELQQGINNSNNDKFITAFIICAIVSIQLIS